MAQQGAAQTASPLIKFTCKSAKRNMTELSESTRFVADATGLEQRMAWVAGGDGMLFIDADGNGTISHRHEFAFTEGAGGAADDLDGLRRAFDSNCAGIEDTRAREVLFHSISGIDGIRVLWDEKCQGPGASEDVFSERGMGEVMKVQTSIKQNCLESARLTLTGQGSWNARVLLTIARLIE